MSVAVVALTCDHYRPYWGGFFNFMERNWDFEIEAPIYFCNEEEDVDLPAWCSQIKTGRGTFVNNLKKALEAIEEEHVFLMLEDFWPISRMSTRLFGSLYEEFKAGAWDALQVSSYTDYYRMKPCERKVGGKNLLKFDRESEWIFNFQARFWKPEVLAGCLKEPEISERQAGSAITVEIASDEYARKNFELNVGLYHYLWYPLSGVAYRGDLTEFGKELQNIVNIDHYVASGMFNSRDA